MIASRVPLLIVIAGIVALAATGSLFAPSPLVIAAQAAAVAWSVWARRSFSSGAFRVEAAPGGPALMTRGPYRYVRHPMYGGVLLLIWSGVLSHRSVPNAAIGLAVTLVVVARIVVEERLLRRRYPEYAEYARSTKALVPFVL